MNILTCDKCRMRFSDAHYESCPACAAKAAGWEIVDNYIDGITYQSLYVIRKGCEIFLVDGHHPDLHDMSAFRKCTYQETIDIIGIYSIHQIKGGAVEDLIQRIKRDIKQ